MPDEPTPKQLTYARAIGVKNADRMSKKQISRAIDAKVKQDPSHEVRRREIVRGRELEENIELEECKWNEFAGSNGYILAYYASRDGTRLDVLKLLDAETAGRKR